MRPLRPGIAGLLALVALLAGAAGPASAALEVVALAGGQPPGTPAGTAFALLGRPVLNEHGEVAFQSTLEIGPGGVDAASDNGIWLLDRDAGLRLVAREGDPAPGAPGGRSYGQILSTTGAPRLNGEGQIAFYGSYKQSSTTVLAIFGPSGATPLTLLAAASLVWGSPPGVPAASFASFERPSLNDAGEVVFLADMAEVHGGVTSQDDGGVWGTLGGGSLALLYREDDPAPPEAGGARWAAWRPPRLNEAGQLAFWASLKGTGVDEYNPYTHWGPGPEGALTLLTRTGDLEPPGVEPGETPASLTSPELAGDGAISFACSLYTNPGTAFASFAPDGAGGHTLLLREGDPAPGLPAGTTIYYPTLPHLNDAGEFAFIAYLQTDGSLVTPADNSGIWGPGPGAGLVPLAREGDPAGDLGPGVLYADFLTVRIGPGGDVLFLADLVQGSGGVTADDDTALLLALRDGPVVALLREGDVVEVAPGDLRTVTAVEIYEDSLRADDRDLVVNSARQVALRASFADGTRAVLLATPDSAGAALPGAAPLTLAILGLLLAATGWRARA